MKKSELKRIIKEVICEALKFYTVYVNGVERETFRCQDMQTALKKAQKHYGKTATVKEEGGF